MYENSDSQFLKATTVIKPGLDDSLKSKPVIKLSNTEGVTVV